MGDWVHLSSLLDLQVVCGSARVNVLSPTFSHVFKLLAADDVTSAHVSVLSCFTDCTDPFFFFVHLCTSEHLTRCTVKVFHPGNVFCFYL